MASEQTRERLIDGVMATLRQEGVAGISARTVAAHADVNQALVFYHFGSVDGLLAAACRVQTARRVAAYQEALSGVTSLHGLLAVGRRIHERERAAGNVTVLAQLLAASPADSAVRTATGDALQLWIDEIETVLRRVLAGGPLNGLVDPAALAHSVSAAFIGLEIIEPVAPEQTAQAFAELDRLGLIAEVLDDLGIVARRAVRAKLARAIRT